MRHLLFPILWMILSVSICADVTSTQGVIRFDVDANGLHEASLNANGLSIGDSLATEKLQVAGNAIFSETLSIGDSHGSSSNLHIQGSMAMSSQTISSDGTAAQHSIILADSSAGAFTLTLPSPSLNPGRILNVKKVNGSANIRVFEENGIDESGYFILSSANIDHPWMKLVSNGQQWYTIGASLEDVVRGPTYTWSGAGADELASNGDNWNVGVAPIAGDMVVFDGTSDKDCTWDIDAKLFHWNQTAEYRGSITVMTRYDASYEKLQISKDMIIAGGTYSTRTIATPLFIS